MSGIRVELSVSFKKARVDYENSPHSLESNLRQNMEGENNLRNSYYRGGIAIICKHPKADIPHDFM